MYNFIDAYGKSIQVYEVSTTSCDACGWDPINEESTNPNCSTCDGFGVVKTETKHFVRGFIKKMDSRSFYREGNQIYQVEPEGDARITIKLDDVLKNRFVSTSESIFTGCEKVIVDGTYYKPKDWERHGVKELHLMTVTLERIKDKTQ
jgi:hypothetical protein